MMSPWWIRNYNIFHAFIPFTLATGNPMLQGTYINYDQSTKKTDGLNYSEFKYIYHFILLKDIFILQFHF